MVSKLTNLKKLIPTYLKPLKPLEKELLKNCIEGRPVSGETNEKNKLEKDIVRATFLCWLFGDKEANKFIHYSGIEIENAFVYGSILLEGATLEFPLVMRKCVFNEQIKLNGAQIVNLDLSGSHLEDGLTANFLKTQASIFLSDGFVTENGVSFRGAEIFGNLFCKGAQFRAKKSDDQFTIDATLANIRGNVSLINSSHKNGTAYFDNSNIRGIFDCEGANFENNSSYDKNFEPESLSLEGAKIMGGVLLRNNFRAVGAVRLHNAIIGGALECDGGSFTTAKDNAIVADGLSTSGPVLMRNGFKAIGCVKLYGARIGSSLDCSRASFENKKNISLNLEKASIDGKALLCDSFASIGTVLLHETTIDGTLDCVDGSFIAEKGEEAINADGLKTTGNVLMRGKFKAVGGARFYGAKIGGNFDCSGSAFDNESSYSLLLAKAEIGGNISLREKFFSKGTVNLHEVTVGGTLDCEDGHFDAGKNEAAINADGVTTTGPVLMRFGFSAIGCVRLYGARIGAELDCQESVFEYNSSLENKKAAKECFIGTSMNVDGSFKWSNQVRPPKGIVVLENATVKSFITDTKSWLEKKDANKTVFLIFNSFAFLYLEYFLNRFFIKPSVYMDGFAYDYFRYGNENDSKAADIERVKNRLMWLSLRPTKHKSLQPYTAVIKSLATSGHGDDARKIAIARERQRSKNLPQLLGLIRNIFYGWTVDYGYSPAKALSFVLVVILAGYFIFGAAKTGGAIIPTQGPVERQNIALSGGQDRTLYYPYPEFVPLAYSIDVFFPIVDLHQEEYWMPSSATEQGVKVLNYMWFHIAAGWLLTTLFVAAITGIVRTRTD